MAASGQASLTFEIGVCHVYPGEKLAAGDLRWGQHTHSFVKKTHTIESLAKAIAADGYSISAVMKDQHRTGENFISAQHLGLDCDQETFESSIDGLLENDFIRDRAAIVHETASSTPEKPRSRVIFILDSPITDAKEYRLAAEAMIWKFGGVDEHCKDAARLFFGRKGARHEVLGNVLYKDVLQEQVIEPYLAASMSRTNGHQPTSMGAGRKPNPEALEFVANGALIGYQRGRAVSAARSYLLADYSVEDTAKALWRGFQASAQDPAKEPWTWEQALFIAEDLERHPLPDMPAPAANGHSPAGVSNGSLSDPAIDDAWRPVGPLPKVPPAPALPEGMVPERLRPWLVDVAQQAAFPLAMVVAPALVSISSVVGRSLGIRPGRFSNWTVVPNLWGAVIARPGFLKSEAINQGTSPVKRLSATSRERFQVDEYTSVADIASLEAEVDGIKSKMKAAAKGKGSESVDHLKVLLAEKLQELDSAEPIECRYWMADATPEKCIDLLKENPRGLLVCYDELSGLLGEMEKPGREGSRAFYLASWEGNTSHYVDRIGRGTTYLPAACLSVIGGIQPDRLRHYLQEATAGGGGGDGLLQRFQLLVSIDGLGEWRPPETWPNSAAKEDAYQVFRALDEMNTKVLGAEEDGDSIPYLRFTPDAQALYDTWHTSLENRLRGDEFKEMPAFEGHMGKYRSLMPSLALLFHLIDIVPSGASNLPVSLEAAQLAADWCDFLEAHARIVYSSEVNPGLDSARRLGEKIKAGHVSHGEAVRDIYRHHWTGLTTSEEVTRGLEVLSEAGWVRVVSQPTAGAPISVVHLHPSLRGGTNA